MQAGYKYRVYCKSDDRWEYTWVTTPIVACPVNPLHLIDVKTIGITDKTRFMTVDGSDGDYEMHSYSVFADTSARNVKVIPPKASTSQGLRFVIKKTSSANELKVEPADSSIDGGSNVKYTEKTTILIESDGVEWHVYDFYEGRTVAGSTTTSVSTAVDKGELVVGDGVQSLTLAPGANGQVLIADSTMDTGLRWGNPTGSWQGEWTAQSYVQGDMVSYNGNAYIAKQSAEAAHDPTNTTYWDLMVAKGADGEDGVQGLKGDTGSSGSTFGEFYCYASDATFTRTKETSWQNRMRLTTSNIDAGKYRIGWSYTYNYRNASRNFQGRISVSNAVIMEHMQEPADSGPDQRLHCSGFDVLNLGAGVHHIDFDFCSQHSSYHAELYEVKLEFWRVPESNGSFTQNTGDL